MVSSIVDSHCLFWEPHAEAPMSCSFASGLFGPGPHLGESSWDPCSRGCLDLQGREFYHGAAVQRWGAGARPQTQALGPALSSAVGDPAGTLPLRSVFTPGAGLQLQEFLGRSKAVGNRGATGPQDTLVNSTPAGRWPCVKHAAITQEMLATKIKLPYNRTMPSTAWDFCEH